MRCRALITLLVLLLVPTTPLVPGASSLEPIERPDGPHCLMSTLPSAPGKALVETDTTCYDTFTEVLRQVGAPTSIIDRVEHPADLTPADMTRLGPGGGSAAMSAIVGIHYDGFNGTPPSLTVNGSDCAGGYTNLTVAWTNRISSTLNGCPVIRHYSGYNLVGLVESTFGFGTTNLTTLNNQSASIQYTT